MSGNTVLPEWLRTQPLECLRTPVKEMKVLVWTNSEADAGNPVAALAFNGIAVFSGACVVTGEKGVNGIAEAVPDDIVRRVCEAYTVVQAAFTPPFPEILPMERLPASAAPIRIAFGKDVVLPWEGLRCDFSLCRGKTFESLGVCQRNGHWFELLNLRRWSGVESPGVVQARHPVTNAPMILHRRSAFEMIAQHRGCKLEKGRGFMATFQTQLWTFFALVYGHDTVVTPAFQVRLAVTHPLTGNFEEWRDDPANVVPAITPTTGDDNAEPEL